jgi:hypothetical protein
MSEETTETTTAADAAETTTATADAAAGGAAAPATTAGVGGIAGVPTVQTLEGLIELIQSQRSVLANSNQRNADTFNQLQKFITEKTTGVSELDGAISAVAGFVTEETPADDEHVVRLTELQDERARTVEQLQNADTQRRNVFNSITMTEGALQILAQVLSSAGLAEETSAESGAGAAGAAGAATTEEGAGTEAE